MDMATSSDAPQTCCGNGARRLNSGFSSSGWTPSVERILAAETIVMIPEKVHKSSVDNAVPVRRVPLYPFVGAAIMVVFQALLFTDNDLIGRYFTPIQWTGLILLLDGIIKYRKGTSLLSDYPAEFVILALISIGSWAIFEGYNVLLKNWTYSGLPDNMVERYFGYAWAFASISPAMFLVYEFLDDVIPGDNTIPDHPRLPNVVFYPFVIYGLASLVVPLIWPSTWMTPLVWMGFAFFLDPINGRLGERSILSEFFTGRFRSMLIFFLAGLVCGLLWEFWNFWADSKWEYAVPYLGDVKLFEMPILGFLGFMPFIIECFAIYVFVRRLLPIPIRARYLG